MTATDKSSEQSVQQVCIDLPGETAECWWSGDKVRVLLRKHRDVIFDIRRGDNKTYTVEATESDFYNARDKKLIFAKRHGTVTFKDGERLPLWVSRGFRGALLLKSDGVVLMRIEPNELDKHQHGEDPKEKPAPIIIALGKAPLQPKASPPPAAKATQPPGAPTAITKALPVSAPPQPVSAATDEKRSVVWVMDGSVKDMPKKLADYFAQGGGKSGLADIDPNEVATRNWIWGQAAGSTAYVADNWRWLAASMDRKTHEGFKLVQAKVHYVGGKVRFYFSGYSKWNTVFGPGGHGPGHDRVMSIFAGVGQTESSFKAIAKGVAGTFKANALVSFVFGSVTAMAEWKADVKKDGYDLAAALLMATLKAIVAAAMVVAFVALVIAAVMLVLSGAVMVVVVGAATIVTGILANYAVEAMDKHYGKLLLGDPNNTDGLAAVIAPWLRSAGEVIEDSWQYLMKKFPNDYRALTF